MNHSNLLTSSLLALALLGAAAPAAANEYAGARAASAVGHWVAAQGNAAVREIRDDLRQRLSDSLKPRLPAPKGSAPSPAPQR
jgi:hypothetical protein